MIKKPTLQLGIMQFITNRLYDLSNNRWSVAYSANKSGYMFRALEGDTDICIIGLDCFIQTKDLHPCIYWQIRHAMGTVNTQSIHKKMFLQISIHQNDISLFKKYPKQHQEKYLKNSSFWNLFCAES